MYLVGPSSNVSATVLPLPGAARTGPTARPHPLAAAALCTAVTAGSPMRSTISAVAGARTAHLNVAGSNLFPQSQNRDNGPGVATVERPCRVCPDFRGDGPCS